MKLIVDSNRLQSDELRSFLSRSPKNVAVLTDYASMEAYKGDTLASIFRSMEVLADFPKQVVVLRGTRAACAQRGRAAGLQRRLIDNVQTLEFPQFVGHLRRAQQGHIGLERQLLEHGRVATDHLDQMLADASTTGSMIEAFATLYSKNDRRNLRAGESLSAEAASRTIKIVLQIASKIFQAHPNVSFVPKHAELGNTFIFRASLATYLLVLDWAARGGAIDASPAKLRNDFVDMNFAAYASYFDGLLSADAKVLRLHTELRLWLIAVFGCQLPSGLGSGDT